LAFEPADEAGDIKPSLNAGSSAFKCWIVHRLAVSPTRIGELQQRPCLDIWIPAEKNP